MVGFESLTSAVERLTETELPELARLGKLFYREGALPGKFVPEQFIATWRKFFELGFGVVFGLRIEGELMGALGAAVLPDPNDGELVGSEMFWWVAPEARGHGMGLLNAYETWAVNEMGAKRIGMVHLLSLAPEKMGKLYERRGYKATEVHYVKEIPSRELRSPALRAKTESMEV